ncbi:MAG: hypothetical protein GWP70_05390 [Proteobacteria bacterium]|nr:hypothetical protein [Pseudomonadota bacterium]
MSESLPKLLQRAQLPVSLSRALQGASTVVSAADMAAAFDRLAVTLTAALQDRNPLVIGLLPGCTYLLGSVLQRTVLPLQVAYANVVAGAVQPVGELPALLARVVLLVDDGRLSDAQAAAVVAQMTGLGASEIWRCSLVRDHDAAAQEGVEQWLSAVVCTNHLLFGCGLDVQGYCRNLPGLYSLKSI